MSHSQSASPAPTGGSPAEQTTLGGSGRKLTLVDVVAQSVGFMGPVFSIAFLVPLVMGIISATGNGAGVAAPLSIAIAGIGVLAVAWIVAEYAKRIQAAGALYDYVTDGLGQKLGAAAGFLYYLGVMALGAGLLVLIAGTIHDTLAGEFSFTGIPVTIWAVIVLVVLAGIMYLGVALSTRFQLVLALLSVATVLLFSIHVILQVGSKNDVASTFNPSNAPGGWSGIAFGIVYGVLLFTGFETAANLGEETEHPKRDIPRAVVTSVAVVAAFYVIVAYAQIAGFGFSLDAMGKAASAPLFTLGAADSPYGGVWIGRLLELVVVLDMLAVLIGISVASSRGIFAMSRDHRFPSVLGKVSGRGTPLNASGVVLVFFAIWIFVTEQFTDLFALPDLPHYFAMFNFGSAFGALALAVIYLLLCVGAVRGMRDHARFPVVVFAAAVGILVTGAAVFGAIYKVEAPTIYAAYTVGVVLVIGIVMALVAKGPQSAHTSYEGLPAAEQGPLKL
jgi:amino acid transporter